MVDRLFLAEEDKIRDSIKLMQFGGFEGFDPLRDWPEEKALTDWLKEQVPTQEISLPDLVAGWVVEVLLELISTGPVESVPPTGT
jgi:hypothetical protein